MLSIVRLSVLESIRRQVHLLTLFLAILLMVLPSLVGAFNMGSPERVVKDIGLTLISYYGLALTLFLSSSAIPAEIERHTIYPLMARPMSRLQFLVAKFASIAVLVVLSLLLLGTCLLVATMVFLPKPDPRIFLVCGEYPLEDMVLGAACMCFSTVASPILAAVLGIFSYIVGGLSPAFISFFLTNPNSKVTAYLVNGFKTLLPHFEFFDIKDAVAHNQPLLASYLASTLGYAAGSIVLFLLLAGLAFERRNL